MFHRLTLSVAVVAFSAIGSAAFAQSDEAASASTKTKATLASYGKSYSSGCATCGPGESYGGYAGGGGAYNGYAGGGGPQAMAYGAQWGGAASDRDCSRFSHYPYVFYPQNFRSNDYYKSSDSLYHRYPAEMQIPVYNRNWHNYYPSSRRYHWGHHFILDVF